MMRKRGRTEKPAKRDHRFRAKIPVFIPVCVCLRVNITLWNHILFQFLALWQTGRYFLAMKFSDFSQNFWDFKQRDINLCFWRQFLWSESDKKHSTAYFECNKRTPVSASWQIISFLQKNTRLFYGEICIFHLPAAWLNLAWREHSFLFNFKITKNFFWQKCVLLDAVFCKELLNF